MPLDVHCPSCREPFPVFNAGREFHVECPHCDAGIGVSVEPPTGKIGWVPKFTAALAPHAAQRVPSPPKPALDDDDAEPARKLGGAGWAVLVGSGVGLLVVLVGLGAVGYVLFTNMGDAPPAKPNAVASPGPPRPANAPTFPTHPNMFATKAAPPPNIPTFPLVGSKLPAKGGFVVNPAPASPFPITPPELAGDVATVTLPDKVSTVRLGGGGRFLVIATQTARLIAFDLSAGRVVGSVQLDREPMMVAAGMTRVVVYHPVRRAVRHFKLPDLAAEADSSVPPALHVTGVAMGSAANGPVAMFGFNEISLYDPEAKALVAGSTKRTSGTLTMASGNEFRASHDGTVFTSTLGTVVAAFRYRNGVWVERHAMSPSPPVVGAGGDVYYGLGQLYDADLKPIGRPAPTLSSPAWLIPAAHGDHFLKMTAGHPTPTTKGAPALTFTVHAGRDTDSPAAELGQAPEVAALLPRMSQAALDRILFLVPDAKLLAVVPPGGDKIILRRLKL